MLGKRYGILTLFYAVLILFFGAVGSARAENFKMVEGEELVYNVSFFGIDLGEIKVINEGRRDYNGKKIYKLKAIIHTYEGIPFVSLHSVYESWMDNSITYSHQFHSDSDFNQKNIVDDISFDYSSNKITHKELENSKLVFNNTFDHKKKWNDGLSLLFLPRKYLRINRTIKIPTFINDKSSTTIRFYNQIDSVEIESVDYPIKVLKISGKADFEGIYGFSGAFKGWFSDDEARVPIKASMKVMIGHITIELKSWKRKNWAPPKT